MTKNPLTTVGVLLAAMSAACAVGPRYGRPPVTVPATFKEQASADAAVLHPAVPNDQSARDGWWAVFGDAQLDTLQQRLLAGSPQLAEEEARVREARALQQQARAAYAPTVSATMSITRGNTTGRTGGVVSGTIDTFDLDVPASWEPDLWGRVRRSVEGATASLQAAAGDLASARLSLSAELAADVFQLRSFDAEVMLLDDTVAADERTATLTLNQYAAGIVSRADVEQADTQLAATQAQAADARLQRAQIEHAIAVLIGVPPAAFDLPAGPLDGEPPAIPPDLPARVLERRPDIAAAERRVAAANAQIGVASAAFFPAVTLSASGGFVSTQLQQWLSWPMRFWSVGPALAMTLFDGGARRAVKAQAVASYDETVAAYRQTVLTAFQDVEDNLAAQRLLTTEAERQQAAVAAAQRSLDISLNQYRAGTVSYLQVAVQQTTLLTNQRAAVSLAGRRFAAAVQLVRALGGGWDGILPTQ
jgi:NodT family efflux transporter outer membrane factor (OMF) lipoprotein